MRYDLEERIKARLYIEYQSKKFRKGMNTTEFREYVRQMCKYVEDNFEKLYYEELKALK